MLQRKIIFYRWLAADAQASFDLHRVMAELAGQIAADSNFAVLEQGDFATAVEVLEVGDSDKPTRINLYALRLPENRPLQWSPGQPVTAIQMDDDQYPVDLTHVMIFPDGYAAQDAHGNAPRPGRLSHFLRKKLHENISFEPLFTPNMIERMKPLKGRLRSAEIAFTRAEYSPSSGGTIGVLWPQALREKVPIVRLALSMGKTGPRDRFLDQAVDDAVFELAENSNDLIEKLVIRGKNPASNRVEEVNLLSERLHTDAQFTPNPAMPSAPRSADVFGAIESAYKNFRNTGILERSVHAQLLRGD
ncbi:hypothetical protein ABH931_000689 [Streptacidiphilus sp. MAP12-33]|uniref:DUF6731 family protein n=1 Tax=Streptacidiphilus sp. MAP12-33 TaxID=3156266 RepID=UPI0035152A4A